MRVVIVVVGALLVLAGAVACSSSSKGNDATKTAAATQSAGKTKTAGTALAGGSTPGSGSATQVSGSNGAGTPGAVNTAASGGSTPPEGPPGASVTPGLGETPGSGSTPGSGTTPGSTPGGGSNTPPTGGAATFSIAAPSNPSGTFTVTVNLNNASDYRGFNVGIAYDATILNVTSIDHGSLLGTNDQQICVPALSSGSAVMGCTVLGPQTVSGGGVVVTVTFQVIKSGSSSLHLVTYGEGGSADGSFLVGGSADSPTAVSVATSDASVTVTG